THASDRKLGAYCVSCAWIISLSFTATTSKNGERNCSSLCAAVIWKASSRSGKYDPYLPEQESSWFKYEIASIHNRRDARNCLNVSGAATYVLHCVAPMLCLAEESTPFLKIGRASWRERV